MRKTTIVQAKYLPAVLLASACSAFAMASPAEAQSASDSSESNSSGDSSSNSPVGLEEIVVTARRREENIQTVPIAVTVLSQQALQDNNVQTLADVQYLVPSLSIAGAGYKDGLNFTIRGQGESSGGPGVVVYVNEVPVPTIQQGGSEIAGGPGLLFDLQNVQVLKGPQGTLFGLNSMGGDVLLQTARPTNEFGGNIQASYGNYNDREINGAVNIPLVSDMLLTRLAFIGQWRDGYSHFLSTASHPDGVDADNRDTWGVRGTVTFRPNDRLQNDTIATYSVYRSISSPAILSFIFPNAPAPVVAYFAQQQALGIRTSLPIGIDNISNGSNLLVSNNTTATLSDGVTFKNIVSLGYTYQYLELNQGGFPLPYFEFPLGGGNPTRPNDWSNNRQVTEEAQLLGNIDQLQWQVGAFYKNNPSPTNFVLQTANLGGGVDDSQQLYKNSGRSRALYAQGTYALLPDVKLTAGVRYTKDDRGNVTRGGIGGSVCYGAAQVNCDAATEVDNRAVNHALTWTAALDYQAAPNTLLYLTSRRGYRAGGFNTGNVLTSSQNPPGFGPEYVTDFEFGTKSDWHIGRVPIRTNADVWYQHYTDIQVTALDPVYGNLTKNAAAARFWGAELEAEANLTDRLQIGINYDYLNRRFTDFSAAAIAAGGTADIVASETLYNPPHKYSVDGRYRLPVTSGVGDVVLQANWAWQATGGDRLVPAATIHAYGLLGASADWNRVYGSPVDISFFGSNLLNKDYVYSPTLAFEPAAFGFGTQVWGEPRLYGVRVRYHFGAEAK